MAKLWINPDNTQLSTVEVEGWNIYTNDDLTNPEAIANLLPEEVWVNENKTLYSTEKVEGFVKL